MSRLAWALARLPVQLMVAGVRRSRALPAPAGERPPIFDPSSLGLGALEWAARAGQRRLRDPEGRWLELVNKVRAFADFRSAADPAAGPVGQSADETELFADLWRREGEGYLRGRQVAGGGTLADEPAPRDLLPHHTGLGLGLARHHLELLPPRASGAATRAAVDGFLEDARRLARPGYRGAVLEALGLAVWLTRPELVSPVDERLAEVSARARQLFWHGLGRGLYFDPGEMPPRPGARWLAAERALEISSDDESRHNSVAGVAWAATLVNFLDPVVVAARLPCTALAEAGDAAVNGIASVAVLWLVSVGDGPSLRRLCDFRPDADAGSAELWRDRVTEPLRQAVDRVYPLLMERERVGELFRYRPVEGWADSLAGETGARREQEMEATVHG